MPTYCRFCRQGNPVGSKFCNECGSQLSLAPCTSCEAINDANASACHQCGAELRPYSGQTLEAASTDAVDETQVLTGGSENDSRSPSSGGDNASQSVAVPTPVHHPVESTNVVTPAAYVQSDVTSAEGVRGGHANEHVELPPIVLPSRSDAHVPENLAASLASGHPDEGKPDNAWPTDEVGDAALVDASHANEVDRADEDGDVPLRDDLRAFRQSLGQRRHTAIGPLVIGAVALLAIGVGAYWYKAEVSGGSTSNEVAVDRSVGAQTNGVAKGATASTPDVNANSPSGDTRDRTETPSSSTADASEKDSANESAKRVANDEAIPSPSAAGPPATASTADNSQRSSETAKASRSRSATTARRASGQNVPGRVSNRRPSAPAPAVATTTPANDADAAATERLIARDLGRFAPRPQPSNRTSDRASADVRDRDAIETQRLVDRDIRAFRDAQRSPPDRAFPEIN